VWGYVYLRIFNVFKIFAEDSGIESRPHQFAGLTAVGTGWLA
jgi:hypothetical protein